jgi:hypothetical protein
MEEDVVEHLLFYLCQVGHDYLVEVAAEDGLERVCCLLQDRKQRVHQAEVVGAFSSCHFLLGVFNFKLSLGRLAPSDFAAYRLVISTTI